MEAKISHSGLLARSPEGHAARGMQIKGNEDVWVEIQANTFRNWVNEHLPKDLRVTDLSQDLCTGVRLCALVEALRGHPLKPAYNKRPANQHHYLENVTTALSAIEQDGVKLVNIGNVDIVNGNLKLILGLIWSLIVRYQIGRSKFPPRKLMLAWLQAVLPECRVHNFTTDWNSGILLSALVDYCKPGLFSHWRNLDKHNGIENCRRAMDIAQRDLGIPAVLEPEYLASPWLDELSGMTYLSYFMKPGSPGFYATLRWVNSRLERNVNNFTSDWNDGKALSEIIRSLGGSATHPDKLRSDMHYWESNLSQALEAGKKLGVQPILSAKDMADVNVEHLGVMAYAAHYQWIPERPPLHDLINVTLNSTSGRVGEPTHFQINLLDSDLKYEQVSVEVRGPDNKVYPVKNLKQGRGIFVPSKVGMHEIVVFYSKEEVVAGHYFRALPQLVEVTPPGMAPCALGSLVQVLVNATGAPKREDILVTAYSPTGRPLDCPLTTIDGTNSATFKPDEPGEWRIEITYQGKQIQGGPFTCSVFDPNGVRVSGLEGALPLVPHSIDLDCRGVGVPGEIHADVVHDKRSVHCRIEKVDSLGFQYRIHFTPREAGKHRVYVYLNGYDVKGSPFMMRVGTQKRNKSSSPSPNSTYRNKSTSPSPNSAYKFNNSSPYYGDYQNKRVTPSPSNSPSYMQRTQSPVYRSDSPDYITSRKLNERRYEYQSSSPVNNYRKGNAEHESNYVSKVQSPVNNYSRKGSTEHESSYMSKMTSMKISDNRSSDNYNRIKSTSSPDGYNRLKSPSSPEGYNRLKSPSSPDAYNRLKSPSSPDGYNRRFNSGYDQNDGGVDTSPIIKVSSMSADHARRDSWDAIAKTRNILSERSLESVANLTDAQLDADIRRRKVEEHNREYNYNSNYTEKKFSSNSNDIYAEPVKYGRNSPAQRIVLRSGGANAVRVQPVPDGVLGQPVEFEIDGSGAGSGDLEILVEGGRVTSSVRSLGGQRFKAAFTPHQALPHRVDIKFNGDTVPAVYIIDLDNFQPESPLLLHAETFEILHANEKSNIVLEAGQSIAVACPGGILDFNEKYVMFLTVSSDNELTHEGKKFDWLFSLKCIISDWPEDVETKRKCGHRGKEIHVGSYIEPKLYFLTAFTVCFDHHRKITEYTKTTLANMVVYAERIETQDGISNWKPEPKYNEVDIRDGAWNDLTKRINKLLGLPEDSGLYLNETYFYASRRLTSLNHHEYYFLSNASYRSLNNFYSLHNERWDCNPNEGETLEGFESLLLDKLGKPLDIYTGVNGVVTLPHQDTGEQVVLSIMDEGLQPISAVNWQLVYEPESKEAVVFVVDNRPAFNQSVTNDEVCSPIDERIKWLHLPDCSSIYSCSYQDAIRAIPEIPDLPVVGLLDGSSI